MVPASASDEEKRVKRNVITQRWRENNREKARARRREIYAANKEKMAEVKRQWRINNPEKRAAIARRSALKQKYGLSETMFDNLMASQNSSCAICLVSEPGGNGVFAVDHCHSSGEVRGLLCHKCNMALGLFKDNGASLQRAIDYLRAAQSKDTRH